jgi:O-antigen/teichoic acid export membrane protein
VRRWLSRLLGQSGSRTLAQDSGITFLSTGLILTVNLVSGVLVARVLGTDGRGELAAIQGLAMTLAFAFTMGARHSISYHHARNPEHGARLLSSWIVLAFLFGVVAVVVGELIVSVLFAAQTDAAVHLARVYMPMTLFLIFGEVGMGVVLGDEDFLFYNVIRFAQPAAIALAYILLWALGLLTLEAALIAAAAVTVAGSVMTVGRAARRHGFGRPDVSLARSTLWYGVRAHGTDLAGNLNARLDLVIIPAFVAAPGVGLYSIATNVAELVTRFFGALATILLPAVTRAGAKGVRTVVRSLHWALGISAAIAILLGALADLLIPLVYGSDFTGSALPLRILLPGAVLLAANSVVWSGLLAINRPFTAAAAEFVGLVVTVVGLLIFLPGNGIVAAAVVSSVSYSVTFFVSLCFYRTNAGLSWRSLLPGQLKAVGAAASA